MKLGMRKETSRSVRNFRELEKDSGSTKKIQEDAERKFKNVKERFKKVQETSEPQNLIYQVLADLS